MLIRIDVIECYMHVIYCGDIISGVQGHKRGQ